MTTAKSENKIIHGMWFGKELSRLELLTLHSFTHHGHEFYLWAYDDLTGYDFPRGVVIRDAEEILPRKRVFLKTSIDPETGVGRNSIAAPFSDLFRYKLLNTHGGIWVDMDITCLRPFDFKTEYVFRPHRVGVVGSILKSPKASALLRKVYAETARSVGPESEYLLANRILSKHVRELGLESYIIHDISNPDHFSDYVRPLIEGPAQIPDQWYAIHWINEMWRTLALDDGHYRGRKLFESPPDKNQPEPYSVLWELYRKYDLIDRRQNLPRSARVPATLGIEPRALPIRTAADQPSTPTHLNILIPSLVRGGAERAVLETVTALRNVPNIKQRLYVFHRARRQYSVPGGDNLKVIFAPDSEARLTVLRAFAWDLLQNSEPFVYSHMIPVDDLKLLWAMDITTVPVVQNMSAAWSDPPSAFDNTHVPFVIGVSDAVSAELRAAGCPKPVITIRHELQRNFAPQDLARQRHEIRNRHAVGNDTLLIGMVGQFKSQKAYTRAVRVLHRVQESVPAKLMILGGWDNEYDDGRTAYEATCRRAVELGVIADMVMPGDVHPIEPYFAAFDVFLNTSIYEGLSIALLEAMATGCPVVTADAGGNRETLREDDVLVVDGANIDAYAKGILKVCSRTERATRNAPVDPDLVPRLWSLIAKHGYLNSRHASSSASGTLFITENLDIGGPQKSLINLVSGLACTEKLAVCFLQGEPLASHKWALDKASIPIFSARDLESVVDKAEFVLNCIDALNVRTLCFWNAGPEIKLTLAKILAIRPIRLVDVSPGQMLFDEMTAATDFQRRISLNGDQYFGRLDALVVKHRRGALPIALHMDQKKIHVVPNGVSPAPNYIPLPPTDSLLPAHLDPALAIAACSRIVPDKQIEFLLNAIEILKERSPSTSLTIIGGPDTASVAYFHDLISRVEARGLENVFFVGPQQNVLPFLSQASLFVMASRRDGCPNASLEAMTLGLPVICTPSGGTSEQVIDGVTGYLVSTPEEMAARILELQKNRRLRAKMGRAARAFVLKHFSMNDMISRYRNLLFG